MGIGLDDGRERRSEVDIAAWKIQDGHLLGLEIIRNPVLDVISIAPTDPAVAMRINRRGICTPARGHGHRWMRRREVHRHRGVARRNRPMSGSFMDRRSRQPGLALLLGRKLGLIVKCSIGISAGTVRSLLAFGERLMRLLLSDLRHATAQCIVRPAQNSPKGSGGLLASWTTLLLWLEEGTIESHRNAGLAWLRQAALQDRNGLAQGKTPGAAIGERKRKQMREQFTDRQRLQSNRAGKEKGSVP